MKVLIVEDEVILAMSYKMDLEIGQCRVIGIASNANDAYKLTELHKPDVVLMDINLHGKIDGIEAADKIITLYNIKVIFITGNNDEITKNRAMQLKPEAYIKKPLDCERLRETLCPA